jgi:hypothetical protein
MILYGKGMAEYVLHEIELGTRAAMWLDSETNGGWSALDSLGFDQWVRERETG